MPSKSRLVGEEILAAVTAHGMGFVQSWRDSDVQADQARVFCGREICLAGDAHVSELVSCSSFLDRHHQ